ncbi:MAG TPA: hypothetical protein VFY06_16035 [Verrucomicrobiae bacterium]|nr:hypothetical protein [Verrucomicrobiae bacterium]
MSPTDAETVMLLLAHLLALVVAVMVFLWMMVLHRRARAMTELPPRKIAVPTFESAFASRPPLWMAVRATDSGPVQAALGLNQATPCSWTEGMTGERKYFIGPPVNGWIIVTGSGLPNPSCDVDECFRFLSRISGQLGQVQLFHADRVLHHHAWARAENGRVIRAYAWAGETIWNQGAKTAAEIELSMKCFGYGDEPNADSWAVVEWTAANVGKVPLLATRWSIDPARINERTRKFTHGIAGESSRVN